MLFKKKDGNTSSIRTTVKTGDSKMSFSNYGDSSKNTVTIKGDNVTSRFNTSGQSMGTAIKSNLGTSYYTINGGITSGLGE
ncbi:MAG: hypothetical protein ACRC30_11915 [Clostridium sp.]